MRFGSRPGPPWLGSATTGLGWAPHVSAVRGCAQLGLPQLGLAVESRDLAVGTDVVLLSGGAQPGGDFVLCSSSVHFRVVAVFFWKANASEALGQPVHRHHGLHRACQS